MTAERDVERILERWLVDGIDEMPDRVYLTILDRVDRQPQQRAWRRLTWRFPTMSDPMKLMAAGATLLVVLVGGTFFLGGGAAPSPTPSPTPTPTPTPTLSPSAFACEDDLPGCAGMLADGTHRSTNVVPPVKYETTGGSWANVIDTPGVYKIESMGRLTPGSPYLIVWTEASIADQAVPCSDAPDPTLGRRAADWAEFVTTHPGIVASDPVELSISGTSAYQVELSVAPDWTQTCPGHAGPYVTLLTQVVEGQVAEYGVPSDQHLLLTVMDIGDRTVVIQSYGPTDATAFDRTMGPIRTVIDSFVMCGPSVGFGPCGSLGTRPFPSVSPEPSS